MIAKRILCFLSLLCVLARCYSLADGERTSTAGELIAANKKPHTCCEAMIAGCMACSQGMSIQKFCKRNPSVDGCHSFPPRPRPCCKAYNLQCLSCTAGLSQAVYCQFHQDSRLCAKYRYGSRKGDLCGFKKKRCRSNRRRSCIKYGPRACGRGLTCRVDKYYYGKSYRRGYQNMYCVRRRRHYYGSRKGDLCGLKKKRCRSNRRRSCIKYGPRACGRGLTCRVDKYYYGKSYRRGYQNMYCIRERDNFRRNRPVRKHRRRENRRRYRYGSRKGDLCGFKKKRCRSNRRRSCIKYGPRPCGSGLTCHVDKYFYGKSYRRGYQNMYCVRR